MFDLHRHDMFSIFDGFGKPSELAALAKELGYESLCTTNHGNTNGWIQTYKACKAEGIKAILGCEGYFLPKWKEKTRGYHLILIAKNLEGYRNLNLIQYEGEKQKYYNPIWDFKLLEKYHEGLICTTACVAGYLSQCILKDEKDKAIKFLEKMKSIFGDDFYIEVQPYKIDDVGTQENVNVESIKLANDLNIKCILTSDSHRGRKEDFDTYLKMHEISGHDLKWVEDTYKERYMPAPQEMATRFCKMHRKDFSNVRKLATNMYDALDEIEDKCELNYLDSLEEILPKLEGVKDSYKTLVDHVKKGLKFRGKYNKKYIDRAKEELDVIHYHGFEDYFLMVEDYANWAKNKGITVGPGRGSACNSIVCYALRITEVDSLYFNLEFRRFLMKERKKMPDIDIDFETARRGEVIEYLLNKYKGHSAKICSYGIYRIDNLINDLAKVCGLPTDKSVDASDIRINKQIIGEIKKYIKSYQEDAIVDVDGIKCDARYRQYNDAYDNIIEHFLKLFNKVRYIGTHASGVAITGGDLFQYTTLKIDSNGSLYTAYDLYSIEDIGVIKFDILGLSTMSEIGDCRKATGNPGFDIAMIRDKKIVDNFSTGNCNGVFQLDKQSVQNLLLDIHTNCFEDVVAATAMNRPGPLKQGMHKLYAANKDAYETGQEVATSDFDMYLGKTYGTIIYQEQIFRMCVDIAGMTWDEAHATTKMKLDVQKFDWYFKDPNYYPKFEQAFVDGCKKRGFKILEADARKLFKSFYAYSFNEGHSVGYTLVSVEQMYYKTYYPEVFWYAKIKYAKNDADFAKYCENAVKDGGVVFLPHVNYSLAKSSLRKVDGEFAIQQGLTAIKGIGEVAAQVIVDERRRGGVFINVDNFLDRIEANPNGSKVNKKVKELLIEYGALDFNKKLYISKVKKYNSALYARANR